MLRGRLVQQGQAIYRFHEGTKPLMLSTYHLRPEHIEEYVALLNRHEIKYLYVYPSALVLFIDYCVNIPRRPLLHFLRGVLRGSERFTPAQRAIVEGTLSVPCYHWYGHIVPIRYRTNDLASGYAWGTYRCGRPFLMLAQIEGRGQEHNVDADGYKIPVSTFTEGLHTPVYTSYRMMQIEQRAPGELLIRLARYRHAVNYTKQLDACRHILDASLSHRVRLQGVEVGEIPRLPKGKHQFMIQHLKDL